MLGYKHLMGYLERYTLIHIKRLHIRIHRIKRADATPFHHTHPFSYISVILRGGYTEDVNGELFTHRVGSVIARRDVTPHRIVDVNPKTVTLFLTWKNKGQHWELIDRGNQYPVNDWIDYPAGIYKRLLYGNIVYSKFDQWWHRAASTSRGAELESRPSIDQSTPPLLP